MYIESQKKAENAQDNSPFFIFHRKEADTPEEKERREREENGIPVEADLADFQRETGIEGAGEKRGFGAEASPRKDVCHEDGEEVIEGDEEGDGISCAFYGERDGIDDIDEWTEGSPAILNFGAPEGDVPQI